MAKFNKLFTGLMLLIGFSASAQDIHFSQFSQAPLALNPALTGNYSCDWRAGLNYRTQWSQIPAPYNTYSAFFDMPVIKGIGQGDNLAAGLLITNDVSGDGNLNSLQVLASVAYHKILGTNHFISLGVQGGLMQKSIDWQNLYFANQFDGSSFDPSLSNGEPFAGDNFNDLDLNIGLVYKGKFGKYSSVEAGGALNHLTSPNETFLDDADNELGQRITAHTRIVIGLNQNLSIIPSVLFMTQSGAQEIVAGADIGYYLKNPDFPATFYVGVASRLNDALIPRIALDYKNFRLGVSYDVNNSDLQVATNSQGGLELSLIYTGCILPIVPSQYILPCPRY